MRTFYKTLLTIVLSALFMAVHAQQTPMPYPKKTSLASQETSTNTPQTESQQFRPNILLQQRTNPHGAIPVSEQFHSPIRWYAVELANDKDYWENVNPERVWLELAVGQNLSDAGIADFIAAFDLGAPVNRSMHLNVTNFYVFNRPGTTPEEFVEMAKLAQSVSGILFLEPSAIRKSNFAPNDPLWGNQWGPYVIYTDVAWDSGLGGDTWNVMAVVDDAIDWNHEDLSDQVYYGYDYGNNDLDPSLDGDQQEHGTHVTGIMAASINNNIGVAGMCNDTVFFAKVTDDTYFSQNGAYSDVAIVNAIYDIATIDRISVVNLSLGGGAPSAADEQAYNTAWNSGKLLVVASGNEGLGTVMYPAAYPVCMAVGSIGYNGQELSLAIYSNYGEAQEVTAPGGESMYGYGIISTMPNNEYDIMQGTSMACPMVAGLAGLMKSINPGLTNVDIRNMINATCFDFGDVGWDQEYGYGMVNAQAAVDMALNAVSVFENRKSDVLTLYPNPANEQLWIKGVGATNGGDVAMFDLNGKLVKTELLNARDFQSISVTDLPDGVYLVQVTTDAKLVSGKFVKSR